jgi:hypothetical protein
LFFPNDCASAGTIHNRIRPEMTVSNTAARLYVI